MFDGQGLTLIEKGAIVIKMLLDLPPITMGMLAENLIEETVRYAHKQGKLVSAHTTSVEAYRLAAKYGVRTNKMCFITHGESIFREFDFLHEAGLSNLEILHGATSTAADIFGLADRGSIAIGKRADLVLVEGDPTKDVSACRNIKKVWVKGQNCESHCACTYG